MISKADPRIHHHSQKITTGNLETVLELYKFFNFEVVYRPEGDVPWAMVGQEQVRFAIQIVEVAEKPVADLNLKRQVHLAFISDDPRSLLQKIAAWAEAKDIKFRAGGWSDRELYFDLPEIFINFVIEVMHTSIEEN